MRRVAIGSAVVGLVFSVLACAGIGSDGAASSGGQFTLAMIPDTQNYVDYSHQKNEGFALDSADLLVEQMQWVAANAASRGGDIAFVASVGDTWQHPTEWIDEEHASRGVERVDNPLFGGHFDPNEKVKTVEIPKAIEAYRLIDEAEIPFGVPPGNHDYDAMYTVAQYPPNLSKKPEELSFAIEDLGVLHVGGLSNFLSAFGADTPFFADKDWYVDSWRGGMSSAQIFTAGGYTFLHLALEMQPGDAVIDWAKGVIARHPGMPTIVSTHDYLSPTNERLSGGFLDFTLVDPAYHNTPQQMFEKLIAPTDQIFLVLCGHYHGQGLRVDENAEGNAVYQILADYQDRGQVGVLAGQPPGGMLAGGPAPIGDGWLRLLRFDTESDPPTIGVETYSTHFGQYSSEMENYAELYRAHEQPKMTDEEFLAAEEFELELDDFRERFGAPQ